MGVNIRLSMKFVLASLLISIALFQVAHATTTCSLPVGTYFTGKGCKTDIDTPADTVLCSVAEVTSLTCESGASGTPVLTGLACGTDKGVFTGATFCTKIQVGITAKFTGLTSDNAKTGESVLNALLAKELKKVCGSKGATQCSGVDVVSKITVRRADTTIGFLVTTSEASAPTALASLNTINSAANLKLIQALTVGTKTPFKDVTLISVLTSFARLNGVNLSSASSMFHFSFLATAMSVAAMMYSKL